MMSQIFSTNPLPPLFSLHTKLTFKKAQRKLLVQNFCNRVLVTAFMHSPIADTVKNWLRGLRELKPK